MSQEDFQSLERALAAYNRRDVEALLAQKRKGSAPAIDTWKRKTT